MPTTLRRRQRGIAALELAFLLPVLVLMLGAPCSMAVYFWHYSALQKSAFHAARYLSTVPVREMQSALLAAHAESQAREIVRDGLADLFADSLPVVEVDCDGRACGGTAPREVRVRISMRLFEGRPGLGRDGGLGLHTETRMRHVGI